MPPLPSSFAPEATNLIDSIRRRGADISNVQLPRLRACPGPLSLHQKLSIELREDIDVFSRHIEDLDALVDDQRGRKNRRELKALVEEFKQTLGKLRKDYRAALLFSKRTIDTSSASNRAELLTSTVVRDARDVNEKATEDAVMQANNNVTEALQRTLNLMQGELERSVLTTQMLDSSMSTLRATSSTHDLLTGAMDASQQLITALQKSDRMDRLLIFFGLLCFFLSVSIVLKERLFDRSVRLAFWWTRFLPSGSMKDLPDFTQSVASISGDALMAASSVFASATASGISLASTATSIVSSASSSASLTYESDASIQSSLSTLLESTILDSTQEMSTASESPTSSAIADVDSEPSQTSSATPNTRDEL
ncbi:Sec20-domain-containing protein [Lentinula raphanica]|nr:Sec20-domain-containing protein [Lentinula raphanica]